MMQKHQPAGEVDFFNLSMAKWVVGVLNMMIAVVGDETLLGLILRQTRSEIGGLIRDEEQTPAFHSDQWFNNN